MRKRLSFLFVLALSAVMAYGVIGSAAQFSSTAAPVTQNLNVGTMTLTLNNPTPYTCTIAVNTASGNGTCPDVSLTVGQSAIQPDTLWVEATVTGAEQPELFTFSGSFSGGSFANTLNAFAPVNLAWPSTGARAMPFTSAYSWANLGNPSMGDTIVVTLTFTATQG